MYFRIVKAEMACGIRAGFLPKYSCSPGPKCSGGRSQTGQPSSSPWGFRAIRGTLTGCLLCAQHHCGLGGLISCPHSSSLLSQAPSIPLLGLNPPRPQGLRQSEPRAEMPWDAAKQLSASQHGVHLTHASCDLLPQLQQSALAAFPKQRSPLEGTAGLVTGPGLLAGP